MYANGHLLSSPFSGTTGTGIPAVPRQSPTRFFVRERTAGNGSECGIDSTAQLATSFSMNIMANDTGRTSGNAPSAHITISWSAPSLLHAVCLCQGTPTGVRQRNPRDPDHRTSNDERDFHFAMLEFERGERKLLPSW